MRAAAAALLLALSALPARAASSAPKVLTVCDDVRGPLTLDPHKEFAEKNHTLLQQIYEGLVRLDVRGRVEPALAVSWERLGPLRVRFHLRRGVRFHDGEPFDAEAVRFSIARYLDPKTGFPARGFIDSISHAEVVDPTTVDIVTKYPDGLLLNRLAGFVLIVPPGLLKKEGEDALETRPVGTGPFRFVRWDRGNRIVLERNPAYWMRGYPKVDRLVFRFLPADRQFQALKSGEIDIDTEFPGTMTTAAMRTGVLKIIKTPTFYTVTASLNTDRPPLSDLRVRQALNYAIDKQDLIRYDLLGNGRVLATVTMPGEQGHDADLKPYPYDLAKAHKMLAEAGKTDGFALEVLVKAQGERAARILAAELARVGVRLNVHLTTDAEVVHELTTKTWDMFIAGCPDPMAHSYFIQSIYLYGHSPYRVAVNPDYDKRLEAMVSQLDDASRERAAKDLDRYVHDQALLLFLYQRVKTYGVRRGVSFVPSITGMPYFFAADKRSPRVRR
jgi:peptide/nickel transport system substrate-binding protein